MTESAVSVRSSDRSTMLPSLNIRTTSSRLRSNRRWSAVSLLLVLLFALLISCSARRQGSKTSPAKIPPAYAERLTESRRSSAYSWPQCEFELVREWNASTQLGSSATFEVLDTAASGSGIVYVVGRYSGRLDVNPDRGADEHTSAGKLDAFLIKFEPNGKSDWMHCWGTAGDDWADGVAVDSEGSVFVTSNSDPSAYPASEQVTTKAENAGELLSRFDQNGTILWTRPVGNACVMKAKREEGLYLAGVTDSSGEIGLGRQPLAVSALGIKDVGFLLSVSEAGDIEWARISAGSPTAGALGSSVLEVSARNQIYLGTCYKGKVILDPEGRADQCDSGLALRPALSKYDGDGACLWTRTWDAHAIIDMCCDSSDNVYVLGDFAGPADFDPGPSIAGGPSGEGLRVFLTRFDAGGQWQWTKTWGNGPFEDPDEIRSSGDGMLLVCGSFYSISGLPSAEALQIPPRSQTPVPALLLLTSDGDLVRACPVGDSGSVHIALAGDHDCLVLGQDGSTTFLAKMNW